MGLGMGQRVGELSGFRLGGVEKGLDWVLKIAIHLEQFTKPSGTPKEIPEGISGEDVAKGAFCTYTLCGFRVSCSECCPP